MDCTIIRMMQQVTFASLSIVEHSQGAIASLAFGMLHSNYSSIWSVKKVMQHHMYIGKTAQMQRVSYLSSALFH
jgi:hypothetical protein